MLCVEKRLSSVDLSGLVISQCTEFIRTRGLPFPESQEIRGSKHLALIEFQAELAE